jgi:hypothetical protein
LSLGFWDVCWLLEHCFGAVAFGMVLRCFGVWNDTLTFWNGAFAIEMMRWLLERCFGVLSLGRALRCFGFW